VIGTVVDGVDTNGIDAQFDELSDVSFAASFIGDWIGEI
jgi:hypothetical protein